MSWMVATVGVTEVPAVDGRGEGVAEEGEEELLFLPPVMEVTDDGRRSFSAPDGAMPCSPTKNVNYQIILQALSMFINMTECYDIITRMLCAITSDNILKVLITTTAA